MSGAELRQLREAAGLSRASLAGLVGVSEQSVYRWETGRCKVGGPEATVLRAVLSKAQAEADARCRECSEPADDGEGWDGLCGNCADKAASGGEKS